MTKMLAHDVQIQSSNPLLAERKKELSIAGYSVGKKGDDVLDKV